MAASIPLIIQSYGTSWSQQATFSFAFWPFSLKLLWAPIVDALFFKRFGRRKTWLIPVQYLIGLMMFILSFYIDNLLLMTTSASHNQSREKYAFGLEYLLICLVFDRYLFSDIDFFWTIISGQLHRIFVWTVGHSQCFQGE